MIFSFIFTYATHKKLRYFHIWLPYLTHFCKKINSFLSIRLVFKKSKLEPTLLSRLSLDRNKTSDFRYIKIQVEVKMHRYQFYTLSFGAMMLCEYKLWIRNVPTCFPGPLWRGGWFRCARIPPWWCRPRSGGGRPWWGRGARGCTQPGSSSRPEKRGACQFLKNGYEPCIFA